MSFLQGKINKLLSKIQAGKTRYKTVLYDAVYENLRRVALLYLDNPADLEETLGKAFGKAFRYISKFDPTKDGYNWLCKIVQNVAYDINEKRKKQVDWEDVDKIPCGNNFEEQVANRDLLDRLLEGYSYRDRKLIEMKYSQEYTYEEIGEELGMSRSNAHKRVQKIFKEIVEKSKNL